MKHSVTEYRFKNGAQGLVIDVPGSSVVGYDIAFNSGFIFGDHDKFELPHVMEHLMGSGNAKYPSAVQFKTEVERNGAYRNASTSPYLNRYSYECADFEADRILDLLGAQIASPLFPEASFPTEIKNVREEIAGFTSRYGAVCYNSLAVKIMPLGNGDYEQRIEQLPSITRDDVVDYYNRTHTAANLRFFMAGNFSDKGKKAAGRLERFVDSMQPGLRLGLPKEPSVKIDQPVLTNKPIKQIHYEIQFLLPDLGMSMRMSLVLLSNLLTGGYRSWVHGEARERGLAYHVSSGVSSNPSVSYFDFNYHVSLDNSQELFKLIASSLARAKAGDIKNRELDEVKDLVTGRMLRGYQTPQDLLSWYAGFYNYEERIQDFDDYITELKAITVEQVVKAAELIANKSRPGVSLLGDITKSQAKSLYDILQPIWLN